MQPSQSFMDNDWPNSTVLDEFGYGLPIGPLLAASSILDGDICGLNISMDAVVNLDDGEAGGALMRTEDVANLPLISSGDFASQAPDQGQLTPDVPLVAILGGFPEHPEHISMQVAPITSAADLKELISTTKVSGITSYWCDYPTCSRRFKTRRQVITHLRHIHLEEKPFKCVTCGKHFAHKQDANRHVNAKNRGKIYGCAVCPKWYAREDYRNKHEKRCSLKNGKK
ncbi:hypothetical protein JB92DRAFT_651700 [Gautieria morchelliformis]|nr:hypothetical protein JB92DRAFT_651700 [Gautieria morchelliformis]